MEVKIIETIPIHPHHIPFSQDHSLPLSTVDTDPNLDHTIRYVRFYANNHPTTTVAGAGNRPSEVIAAALSHALVHYYPLAGCLRFNGSRLESFCTAVDQLPLVNASVNATLESAMIKLENPVDSEFVTRLAPDPSRDERLVHPFMVQVTMFECGGFALGSAVHHAICDGMGATLFFNAVAELARGSGRVPVEPVWERGSFFTPRDPPRVEGLVREVLLGDGGDRSVEPVVGGFGNKVVMECFDVKEEWLEEFKKVLVAKCGSKFTTFEALGAFIWRAKVKASGVPPNELVKFTYSINIRKLANLPPTYWGNGCVPMHVELRSQDLLNQPIWETAELIKQSKVNVQSYVVSFVDALELHHLGRVNLPRSKCVSGFTDWRHLGHSGLDFGWGGPVCVYPLPMTLLGSEEPCFYLPAAADGGGGGGFKVMVMLREELVDGFMVEVEKFGRQEF
ncbi:Spermidine sinapoyl-CoA acyltransferase [Linum grandiflorum]